MACGCSKKKAAAKQTTMIVEQWESHMGNGEVLSFSTLGEARDAGGQVRYAPVEVPAGFQVVTDDGPVSDPLATANEAALVRSKHPGSKIVLTPLAGGAAAPTTEDVKECVGAGCR